MSVSRKKLNNGHNLKNPALLVKLAPNCASRDALDQEVFQLSFLTIDSVNMPSICSLYLYLRELKDGT